MSGNGLSWAYTFEWPLFAGFAVVFWAKTIRDEFRIRRGEMPDPRVAAAEADRLPAGVVGPVQVSTVQASAGSPAEDEDEELSAYNAYLARLNAEVKDHCDHCWWKRRRSQSVTILSFASNICIAAIKSRRKFRGRTSWVLKETGSSN